MPRVRRNQGVRSGRGQKNLSMAAPMGVAAATATATAVPKRGVRLKTVSVCAMVLALSCVFAFPSMRDQVTGKSASPRGIYRTEQHGKGAARSSSIANSKT